MKRDAAKWVSWACSQPEPGCDEYDSRELASQFDHALFGRAAILTEADAWTLTGDD